MNRRATRPALRNRLWLVVVTIATLAACASAPVETSGRSTNSIAENVTTTSVVAPAAAGAPVEAENGSAADVDPALEEPASAEAADDPVVGLPPARPRPQGRVSAASASSVNRIEIPAIGLSHVTYEGIDLATINKGPSHWPDTPFPGESGNTVFPGHRTTYSRPFWDIDKLVKGDEVIFTNAAGRFTYRVTDAFVVGSRDTWILGATERPTFTIFACHPKGSARQRYVVKGELISTPARSAPPPTASTTTSKPPSTATAPTTTSTTTTTPGLVPDLGG